MKRFLSLTALAVWMTLCLLLAACAEEAADPSAQKREKLASDALTAMTKYTIDKYEESYLQQYFEWNTPAWEVIHRFDKGYYPSVSHYAISDIQTENWQKLSDSEYSVEIRCHFYVKLSTSNLIEENYDCHYRFYIREVYPNGWRVYDFETLPSPEDAELCRRLSELRPGIHFEAVCGKTFRGILITVDDPADIFVGTCDYFGADTYGLTADAMSEKYGAFMVINGGGFTDNAKGGDAKGVVISQGNVLRNHTPNKPTYNSVAGITADNRMAIGCYTAEELNALNLRDAVAFSPLLISDSAEVNRDDASTFRQYTIRVIVAEDAEGHAVFFIAKGRQPDSFGATTKGASAFLMERGMVSAVNMDGGTSAALYVNGESIYSGSRVRASRRIPTAFIIGAEPQADEAE